MRRLKHTPTSDLNILDTLCILAILFLPLLRFSVTDAVDWIAHGTCVASAMTTNDDPDDKDEVSLLARGVQCVVYFFAALCCGRFSA